MAAVDCRTRRGLPTRWAAGLIVAGLCAGCDTTGWHSGPSGTRDDIVSIYQLYMRPPWLRDEEGRISGVRVRVYLVPVVSGPNDEPKGVFVPGIIKAMMYALTPRPDGTYERELVHEWDFTARQAAGFRLSKRSMLGDSYGFYLRWPDDVDVLGRAVVFEFSYQRRDGKVIVQRGSRLPVPAPAGYIPSWPARTSSDVAPSPVATPPNGGGTP